MKPVVPRQRAVNDIEEAVDRYLVDADVEVAVGFVDELERAFRQLGEHPGSGSPRWAGELRIPGLRSWPLNRYPYVVFYRENEDRLDVWRVLHVRRDMAGQLP